jgi:hypothetical protein
MSAASTTNSAEDWTPEQEGDVANAVSAAVLSPRLNLLYSTDQLVEFQYAPNGVPSLSACRTPPLPVRARLRCRP